MVAATVALTTFIVLLIPAPPASAHDSWDGAYRKWPWKAGQNRLITTRPGQCPHCPSYQSPSAWRAIDIAMNYETVFAIAPGRVDASVASGGAAGKYLRVRDDDGTYVTYEHLQRFLVTSGRVVAGQPIAVTGCTGNCSGPHLHLQRHDGPGFSSSALPLEPISAHPSISATEYLSDNAGIAHTAGGASLSSMREAYESGGGYAGFGVTAHLHDAWTPCRNDDIDGTPWRFGCHPRDGITGSVQTFYGPDDRPRAIMHEPGEDDSYRLKTGILAAYTERYQGHDWVYWLGYPTGNRKKIDQGLYKQPFRNGHILFDVGCTETMVVNGVAWMQYHFCD